MNTGLMWFDNDPHKSLSAKIQQACNYYKQKFGRLPELCLVSPTMLGNHPLNATLDHGQKITVRAYRSVLPGHFWIGIEEQKA